jgi:hypothetical protein
VRPDCEVRGVIGSSSFKGYASPWALLRAWVKAGRNPGLWRSKCRDRRDAGYRDSTGHNPDALLARVNLLLLESMSLAELSV